MIPIPEPHLRFLRLLGLDPQAPTLAYLREIVFQTVCRVPFENVSKLLLYRDEGIGRALTIDEFLDGIEHRDLGGTCYSCNPFLAGLLRALGFDADLLAADMSVPNIHTTVRVRLHGLEYHVDAGYGGPFREPLCLDDLPETICEGSIRYRVERHPEGDVEVTQFSAAGRLHGYRAHGPARSPDFFLPVILDSFQPGKTFMTCLRIVRIFPDHSVELHNRTLTVHRGGESQTSNLASMAELRSTAADQLAMPRCPIEEAVDILATLNGQDLF